MKKNSVGEMRDKYGINFRKEFNLLDVKEEDLDKFFDRVRFEEVVDEFIEEGNKGVNLLMDSLKELSKEVSFEFECIDNLAGIDRGINLEGKVVDEVLFEYRGSGWKDKLKNEYVDEVDEYIKDIVEDKGIEFKDDESKIRFFVSYLSDNFMKRLGSLGVVDGEWRYKECMYLIEKDKEEGYRQFIYGDIKVSERDLGVRGGYVVEKEDNGIVEVNKYKRRDSIDNYRFVKKDEFVDEVKKEFFKEMSSIG